jgi:hypothetical protein
MSRLADWIKSQAPTRESFEKSRILAPFAHRVFVPALWRFTRRSVPRGVALGILVGIFLLIPGVQIIAAVLLSLPVRANIPIAAAMTFLSMPATTPFILAASIYIGNNILGMHADIAYFELLIEKQASFAEWITWLLSEAAPALLVGLAMISVVLAALGYVIASFGWRWWLISKWKKRLRDRQKA